MWAIDGMVRESFLDAILFVVSLLVSFDWFRLCGLPASAEEVLRAVERSMLDLPMDCRYR